MARPATKPTQPAATPPPPPEPEPELGPAPEPGEIPGPPQPATIAPPADPALAAPSSGPEPAPSIASGDDASEREKKPTITPEDIEAYQKQQRDAERKDPKRWRHEGLVLEFNIGTQGCFGSYCKSAENIGSKPGVRLSGMLGRNSFGILDLGFELGWGTLTPGEVNGRSAADLYDLDPIRLQEVINERLGIDLVEFDLSQAIATSVKLRTLNAGPTLRVHVLRKGRYDPFLGTGFHYQMWRARYETLSGPARLDFHGFAIPLQVGFNVFVHPNVAVGARFDYMFTYYVLTNLDHPDAAGVTIVSSLDAAALDTESDTPTQDGLPRFWAVTLGARARF